MRKFFATILLLSFLGQTFNQGWYYIGYLLQKKEYVKRCENKSRPQLHCNGKCQLMKRMEERRKKEQGLPPELKMTAKAEVISSRSSFAISPVPPTTNQHPLFISHDNGTPVDQPASIFHPPPVC